MPNAKMLTSVSFPFHSRCSSPLDLNVLSPQSAIATAAAAAAAAACANDPNKFQALLLERTKAFAAEALKNGSSDAVSDGEYASSRAAVPTVPSCSRFEFVSMSLRCLLKRFDLFRPSNGAQEGNRPICLTSESFRSVPLR